MKSVPLMASPRAGIRRAGAKKLRETGFVPAVIYGRQASSQPIQFKRVDVENLLNHAGSENILLDLTVSGGERPQRLALIQEVQHHPLSGKITHLDLHEVLETEKVTVQVPIEAVGVALGIKSGGVLEHVLFKVKLRGLPKDLPETLKVDVTNLDVGKSIHIGDIKPPDGCEILGGKTISVLTVAEPITEEQEQAATAAAEGTTAGDVEMIKEKKEDGEGAEPAKPGDKKAAPAAEKAAAPAAAEKKAPAKK